MRPSDPFVLGKIGIGKKYEDNASSALVGLMMGENLMGQIYLYSIAWPSFRLQNLEYLCVGVNVM